MCQGTAQLARGDKRLVRLACELLRHGRVCLECVPQQVRQGADPLVREERLSRVVVRVPVRIGKVHVGDLQPLVRLERRESVERRGDGAEVRLACARVPLCVQLGMCTRAGRVLRIVGERAAAVRWLLGPQRIELLYERGDQLAEAHDGLFRVCQLRLERFS